MAKKQPAAGEKAPPPEPTMEDEEEAKSPLVATSPAATSPSPGTTSTPATSTWTSSPPPASPLPLARRPAATPSTTPPLSPASSTPVSTSPFTSTPPPVSPPVFPAEWTCRSAEDAGPQLAEIRTQSSEEKTLETSAIERPAAPKRPKKPKSRAEAKKRPERKKSSASRPPKKPAAKRTTTVEVSPSRYFPDAAKTPHAPSRPPTPHEEKSVNISVQELAPRRGKSAERLVDTGKVIKRRSRRGERTRDVPAPPARSPSTARSAASDEETPTVFERPTRARSQPAVVRATHRWIRKQPIKLTRKKPLGMASDQIGSMREEAEPPPRPTPIARTPPQPSAVQPPATPPAVSPTPRSHAQPQPQPQPAAPKEREKFGQRLARVFKPKRRSASRQPTAPPPPANHRTASDPSNTASANTAHAHSQHEPEPPK